jgi:CRP/FNR family transcriptional regulator, dissimilatory nitrate respiration regulator
MDFNQLLQAPLFRGLSINEIEKVMNGIPKKIRKFKAGAFIAYSGEKVNSMMIVLNGTVKGEMVDYSGRMIKIEDIPAPGALAAAFLFGSRNNFPVNVIAISETELLIIEKPEFLRMLMSNDIILANFLDMISNRSQFLSEKIKFLNFKTIKGKLAQFLLQRAGKDVISFSLNMTQADLADFFGVARPSVARALGEMEEEGLIKASGKNITIRDKMKLKQLTND